MDNITPWTRLSLTELVTNVENRHQWRKIGDDAANPGSEVAEDKDKTRPPLTGAAVIVFPAVRK